MSRNYNDLLNAPLSPFEPCEVEGSKEGESWYVFSEGPAKGSVFCLLGVEEGDSLDNSLGINYKTAHLDPTTIDFKVINTEVERVVAYALNAVALEGK